MNKADSAPDAPATLFQMRIEKLEKVILETPALLNMIKHCQDKTEISNQQPQQEAIEVGGARGTILGVLKKDLKEQNLLVTSTVPENNKVFKTLKQIQEAEKELQKQESNNEIGFYVSCQLGMAFSHKNLLSMIGCYRNFRNSCMIVYDVTKSPYGLNPLKCYRLSQSAINSLSLNSPAEMTDQLL
jgi:hypothetical protein